MRVYFFKNIYKQSKERGFIFIFLVYSTHVKHNRNDTKLVILQTNCISVLASSRLLVRYFQVKRKFKFLCNINVFPQSHLYPKTSINGKSSKGELVGIFLSILSHVLTNVVQHHLRSSVQYRLDEKVKTLKTQGFQHTG